MFSAGDPGHVDEHNRLSAIRDVRRFASIQAAIDEGPGTVFVPNGTWIITSPLTFGSGVRLVGESRTGTIIASSSGAAISVTGSTEQLDVQNIRLSSSAGHVVSVPDGGVLGQSSFKGCLLTQTGGSHSVFSTVGQMIEVLVEDSFLSIISSGTASVVSADGPGNRFNHNRFVRCRLHGYENSNVPAFFIQSTDSNWHYANHLVDLTFEQLRGGLVEANGVNDFRVEGCHGWDVSTTYVASLFKFGPSTGETARHASRISIRNSGRIGGALAEGVFDVEADANSLSGELVGVGSHFGDQGSAPSSYSVPESWSVA